MERAEGTGGSLVLGLENGRSPKCLFTAPPAGLACLLLHLDHSRLHQ